MKKITLITVACCMVLILHAQRATNEQPYSLRAGVQVQKQDVIVLTAPDKEHIEKEDLINDKLPGPVCFAYPVWVNYTLENSGVWQQLDDGSKIWRLKVNIPDALSTNTYYDKFWLPEGGKFFVYNEDTEQSIGAIISDFIGGSKEEPIKFATALIYGENVVYEYYQPASVKELPIISISNINYGYRYVNNPYKSMLRSLGDAKPCHININCPEGNNWQTEKHAVTRVFLKGLDGKSYWCSCALINNAKNDYTPYVLTADHCLYGLDALGNRDASQWVFYWDYERPGCPNSSSPTERTSTGATVEASNPKSDFALLRIKALQDPRYVSGFTPYYLGWDRSGIENVYQGAGIHHPKGDAKKISLISWIQNVPNQITWQDDNGNVLSITPANTHWGAIIYKGDGFIENGSSGSPLLNDNGRVVGQLHGGSTKLSNGVDVGCDIFDYYNGYYNWFYGRFDVSWTDNNTNLARRQLSNWLDPDGINTTKILDGIAYQGIPVGFNDYVSIENPGSGCSGYYGSPLPNTYIIEPCSLANFYTKFVSGGTSGTYSFAYDWSIVLYRSNGTKYVYAQQTGMAPNTSCGYTSGCFWQFTAGALPAYEWLYDMAGNIYGKVKVAVHISDGEVKYDETDIGVVLVKNINGAVYNANTTINACSDIKLTNVKIQGTPTVTFNMNGHDITIDETFDVPVGATFNINP